MTEEECQNRGLGDRLFSSGLEVFLFFTNSHEAIGERKFDCVKIGHLVTLTDQVFFEKFELGGFAAAIHAGKSDVLHRLRVSKSGILSNDRLKNTSLHN